MIAVLGEALIDLVIDHSGKITVRPGRGPFNTARTLGSLGSSPTFLGRLSSDVHAVHTGALALVMEPVAAAIERLIAHDLSTGTLLMIDPNCRADVIKASVEDLAYLAPYVPARDAAESPASTWSTPSAREMLSVAHSWHGGHATGLPATT